VSPRTLPPPGRGCQEIVASCKQLCDWLGQRPGAWTAPRTLQRCLRRGRPRTAGEAIEAGIARLGEGQAQAAVDLFQAALELPGNGAFRLSGTVREYRSGCLYMPFALKSPSVVRGYRPGCLYSPDNIKMHARDRLEWSLLGIGSLPLSCTTGGDKRQTGLRRKSLSKAASNRLVARLLPGTGVVCCMALCRDAGSHAARDPATMCGRVLPDLSHVAVWAQLTSAWHGPEAPPRARALWAAGAVRVLFLYLFCCLLNKNFAMQVRVGCGRAERAVQHGVRLRGHGAAGKRADVPGGAARPCCAVAG